MLQAACPALALVDVREQAGRLQPPDPCRPRALQHPGGDPEQFLRLRACADILGHLRAGRDEGQQIAGKLGVSPVQREDAMVELDRGIRGQVRPGQARGRVLQPVPGVDQVVVAVAARFAPIRPHQVGQRHLDPPPGPQRGCHPAAGGQRS